MGGYARYRVLFAAMVIEIALGFQYAWAIFGRVLQNRYGFSASESQAIFTATVVFFSGGFLIAGRIQDRMGPRLTTVIGGLIYGAGLIVAGIGGPRFDTMFVGAGVMVGLGIAFGYIGPLATPVKWFPGRKGTVTGLVAGAFASGTFFLGGAAQLMIAAGYTIFTILIILGIVSTALILALACCLTLPPEARARGERVKVVVPAGLLRGGHFWSLIIGFFSGTFAGLAVIGALSKIGETMAAGGVWVEWAIPVFAWGNTLGRAAWGLLFERLSTRRAVPSSLLLQAGTLVLLAFFGGTGPAFAALAFVIGLNYGGNFVLYAAEIAHTYGAHRVGTVYGFIYVVYIISGLTAPTVAGRSFDSLGTYTPAIFVAAAVALAGAAGFVLVYRRPWEPPAL